MIDWVLSHELSQMVSSSVTACGNKVDPVYEALRFGTSLAQRTKKGSSGSGCESPHRTSVIVLLLLPFTYWAVLASGPAV